MRAVAEAAFANGREVVAIGRAMDRVIQVAGERGYFDGLPPFRSSDTYGYLPRDKVVALLTGSQGEPRAALARVAEDEHPDITLASGDTVILSSRTIPGNEKPVGRIVNNLIRQGIQVITDRTHMVHVSGHPRRGELERLYQWVRPKVAVPVHGEALHLHEHAVLARALGVPEVIEASDGDIVLLGPERPSVVDQAPSGRMYKDGSLLIGAADSTVAERRRLSFAGVVSVALALNSTRRNPGRSRIRNLGPSAGQSQWNALRGCNRGSNTQCRRTACRRTGAVIPTSSRMPWSARYARPWGKRGARSQSATSMSW